MDKATEKRFNLAFNIFLVTGMIVAVTITTVFKLQQPGVKTFILLLAAFGSVMGVVNTVLSNDTDLPPKSVEQVFDRFTRLDNAEGVPGAGLGLSHVKEIVRAHNGRISAKVADGVFSVRVSL